ncbi:YaaC family protein [Bacillus horti]|uniref:YaaC family protein n=1 Tax=Caldalkalibacillus horti TaxID=77523 RepID=A0ABT9W2R6_9BACI|nr:YaaC family protein [Bacillus horti]MDQ0167534.1 hypothetical protein [Bacillus horti]
MIDSYIKTEDPMQKIWSFFHYYQNEPNVKALLLERYKAFPDIQEEKQALRLAYENTHKLIYFLKQGVAYFKSAKESEFIVRPLLLYYGVTSLMKAVILINDPFYPRTTAVLQHGITTRKKKKLHYQFLLDEIKVQRDGLLPLFAEMTLTSSLKVHSKFKVRELLSMVPELQDIYTRKTGEQTLLPVHITEQPLPVTTTASLILEDRQAATANMWELRFIPDKKEGITQTEFESLTDLFVVGLSEHESLLHSDQRTFSLHFESKNPLFTPLQHPQICRNSDGSFFFYTKGTLRISDELVVINMLSYLLGMLCRYDTELWGELVFSFSSSDTYLIEEILQLILRKFPNLVLNQIYQQNLIFIP